MLALLYDIHGNLPALEEVLKDAEGTGAGAYLLGGDFASWSPWPRETIERLRGLPNATWIRGNGERWLREPPVDRPEVIEALSGRDSGLGTDEGWLYSLQSQFELQGVLYVHGSPRSDVESFAPEPGEDDERMLNGVRGKTVVFGHSHQQFRRPGPNGTTLLKDDGEFEFRRVAYDVERAALGWERVGGDFGKFAAQRVRRGSD